MKDAYVTYTIVNSIYHIEMKIDGEFICGGITGVKDFNNAYSFASKIAKNHNARLAWFRKEKN